MIINSLKEIEALPEPSLGLLRAVHDAEVEDTAFDEAGGAVFPAAVDVPGRVYRNQSTKPISLPSFGKWPARTLGPGLIYASDGRLFYEVRHKEGTTSYYPESFERTIYSFSFTKNSFPPGSAFEFERLFYFRLIANNVTAVWSVVMEIGMREDAVAPELIENAESTLIAGSRLLAVEPEFINRIQEKMRVSGEGIPSGSTVELVNVQAGTVQISRPATASGARTVTFSAPVGPNLVRYRWLRPMLDVQVTLTELKSINPLGIWFKSWGSKTTINPLGEIVDIPERSDLGFEGRAKIYDQTVIVPPESLPTGDEFLVRVRVGQFDIEDRLPDAKGFAAYVVRAITDPEEDNEESAGVS